MNTSLKHNELNLIHISKILVQYKILIIINMIICIIASLIYINLPSKAVWVGEVKILTAPLYKTNKYSQLLALENYYHFTIAPDGKKYRITKNNDANSWIKNHFLQYINFIQSSDKDLNILIDSSNLFYTVQFRAESEKKALSGLHSTLNKYNNLYLNTIILNYKKLIHNQILLLDKDDIETKEGLKILKILNQNQPDSLNPIYQIIAKSSYPLDTSQNNKLFILSAIIFSFLFSGLIIFIKKSLPNRLD